jgi:hypothetical protein
MVEKGLQGGNPSRRSADGTNGYDFLGLGYRGARIIIHN